MRTSGVLFPVFSLPGKYGIGCFSEEAYKFVDFLAEAGQTYWQILPLGPTGYGDSPYQAFSTFAGNPYLISLEDLIGQGLLTAEECDAADFGDGKAVDYGKLYNGRFDLLRKAYERSTHRGTAAFAAFEKENEGGFATIIPKKVPQRGTPLTPFGSESLKKFRNHCTACQLCVSVCPNGVLRPSKDPARFMQPEMSFERGYCRPECVKCSEVCPTGAILKITPEEKTTWKVGTAAVDYDLCIVAKGEVEECGNCARHCPVGAIKMVRKDPDETAEHPVRIPTVNEAKCIGCGACENLCPARPISAITVSGCEVHHTV